MLLATSNAQGELTPLERGFHALKSGMDVKSYATSVGRKLPTVSRGKGHNDLSAHFGCLTAIHAAPE